MLMSQLYLLNKIPNNDHTDFSKNISHVCDNGEIPKLLCYVYVPSDGSSSPKLWYSMFCASSHGNRRGKLRRGYASAMSWHGPDVLHRLSLLTGPLSAYDRVIVPIFKFDYAGHLYFCGNNTRGVFPLLARSAK